MAQPRIDLGLSAVTNGDDLIYDPTADNGAGDFVFAFSDTQHIKDTINACVGWWKQNPDDGVGLINYYKSQGNANALLNKLRTELNSDGYSLINPIVTFSNNGVLSITPNCQR